MRYRAIHFHLDYVARYNRILAGLETSKNHKFKTLGEVEKAKNHHEAAAAALLVAGIKKGRAGRGEYERTEKHINGWYEKVTAAKNLKREAAGLAPYRAAGTGRKPRKR